MSPNEDVYTCCAIITHHYIQVITRDYEYRKCVVRYIKSNKAVQYPVQFGIAEI